jgi:hypothetical protein
MIKAPLYTLLHRSMSWGVSPLIATRTVAADAATLHRFLRDPANQLCLAGEAHDVSAHVESRAAGRVVSVELLRGPRTVLWLTWILSAGRGTTEVDLAVQFETRGPATRLALVLGGRRWLTHRAEAALERLALVCARAAEDVVAAPPPATDCGGRARATRAVRGTDRARLRHR